VSALVSASGDAVGEGRRVAAVLGAETEPALQALALLLVGLAIAYLSGRVAERFLTWFQQRRVEAGQQVEEALDTVGVTWPLPRVVRPGRRSSASRRCSPARLRVAPTCRRWPISSTSWPGLSRPCSLLC
jgi:hypothetical protein